MKTKTFALLLVAIMLMGSLASMGIWGVNNIVNISRIGSSESIENQLRRSGVFVDQALLKSLGTEQKIFIVFKDRIAMKKALSKMETDENIRILYKYRIIPAVLVEGKPSVILNIDIEGKYVLGYYSNKKYYTATALPTKKIGSSQANPTTTDSTNTTGAPAFWNAGYDGENIVVCVIDTGIDAEHPELSGKVIYAKSFVKKIFGFDEDIDDPSDGHGHGTAVAGVVAGKGLDPRGQGMAPGALLMNARVFPPGKDVPTTLAAIIAAIEWATFGEDGVPDTGDEADIINMSIGGGPTYYSPTWLAIKVAVSYGVTVVVAAGNEGDSGRSSLSVGAPADAPEAIAVGATDPFYTDMHLSYTSLGPTALRAAKPDVSAPSGVIILDYRSNGYTLDAWIGTSFSAPHVAGAAALIAEYLANKGVPKEKWPGLIRTVLMKTARPIGTYEDMIIGSGAIDLRSALKLLNSATVDSSTFPQWITALPKKIPVGISEEAGEIYEPYFPFIDRVFKGQHVVFNLSISLTKSTTLEISLSGDISKVFRLHSPTRISASPPVVYWEFNATVREDVSQGSYSGSIKIYDEENGVEIKIPVSLKVVKPSARVLIDLRHTDWATDQRYGQYRLFVRALETLHDICVDEWLFGSHELTYELLSKYDLVIAPDTASMIYYYYENGTPAYWETLDFSPSEIDAIRAYVEDGGVFFLFALDYIFTDESGESYIVHNVTNINEILAGTGISLVEASIKFREGPIVAETTGRHMLIKDIPNLPYYGIKLVTNPEVANVFLGYGDNKLAAVYQYASGGAFIVTGTNFILDNWAFLGVYSGTGNGEYIYTFVSNLVDFVLSGLTSVDVSVSITAARVGGSVSVLLTNVTSVAEISWREVGSGYSQTGSLEYDPNMGVWTGDVPIGTNGTVYIVLSVEFPDGSVVEPIIKLTIGPPETNPPIITLGVYENNSVIKVGWGQTVDFVMNISDDTKILMSFVDVKMNIPNCDVRKRLISKKLVMVSVVVPFRSIEGSMWVSGRIKIIITVEAADDYLNSAESTYVLILESTLPPMILIVGIIIVVVILVAVFAIRKFKLKK
ncbi:MAG: hypothetical protein DRJ18_02395 [Candidatus Methanomethylicota archaeon]|nr:MAG: hypothetical protein DRJ18_02395 [Candidatus Verstraetearchaeota archaeon]